MATTSEWTSVDVDVARTFRSSPTHAWALIASSAGAAAWLGGRPDAWWRGSDGPEEGVIITLDAGGQYEVADAEPGSQICLRALGPDLPPLTALRLTLTPERGRTIVELRHEGLPDPVIVEVLRERWSAALDRIGELLDGDDAS